MAVQKITPFFWFEQEADQAADFYVAAFSNSRVLSITRNPHSGNVLIVEFVLAGVKYIAMNGGPHFKLNEAFSMMVNCDSQAEIDELWEKLSEGGTKSRCGWLKDRYGLSWQVVPSILPDLMKDPQTAGKVMGALMEMTKLDIAALQLAATSI